MEGKANPGSKVTAAELNSKLSPAIQKALERIAKAASDAPDGQWISGSEHQIKDAIAELGRAAQEAAIQIRTDAAEASFSPSKRPAKR